MQPILARAFYLATLGFASSGPFVYPVDAMKHDLEAIKDAGKRIRKSRSSALDFLVRHGFVTKTGKLTKRYGG